MTEDDFPTHIPEPVRWTREQQLRWAQELMRAYGLPDEPPGGVTRTTISTETEE